MKKAILAKPGERLEVIDFVDDLQFYYKHIECRCIDIVYVKDYLLIVDDEGLLVDDPQVNVVASIMYGHPICGNVLIVKEGYTDEGEPTCEGLTDEEVGEFHESFMRLIKKVKKLRGEK